MSLSTLLRAAAVVVLVSGPALASSDPAPSADVTQQITDLLTAQGYEVRRVATEDGLYEAYAVKDGHMYEIYLNAALEIVRTSGE